MNTVLLELLISALIVTSVTIGGMSLPASVILNTAKAAAKDANVSQLQTALALYYFDNQRYPQATSGEALIQELTQKGYVSGHVSDPSVFTYSVASDSQTYTLAVEKN